MKRTFRKYTPCLLSLAATFVTSLAFGQAANIIYGPTGTEASISNPDGNWIHNWGSASYTTTFDAANPPPTGDTTGSIYNHGDWTGDTGGMDNYNEVSLFTWASQGPYFDGTAYASIQLDFKYDTNSTMTPVTAPHLGIGLDCSYNFCDMEDFNITNGVGLGDGNWHHLSIPISITAFTAQGRNSATTGGISYYQWNPAGTSGTMSFWTANAKLIANIGSIPSPTVSITSPKPGLHFVQGSISGQYDRQNITTANGANSSANYSWSGVATTGNPVTYSVNISQFTAPDLNYHIFVYQTAGAGGASAPDYNQPNVLDLQITPIATNTQAQVQLFWKTNLPTASTTNIALAVTNPVLTGTWQLQFTSNTGGQVLAPGGNSYPFTLDPSVAAALVNPVTVNFGINPSINSTNILGEEVLVSQAGVSGVDALSTNYSTSDNFLTDSNLDPATWTVNALNPPSIWFVPGGTAYSVGWNIPDSGFSLIENGDVLSMSNGVSVGTVPVGLIPGKRTLIAKSALLPGNGFFALIKRSAYQLQVLLPGETNAPNTVSGKIGTPISPQSISGTGTMITVNMCDSKWNIVNSIDTVHITSSDSGALLPADASLVSGTLQETVIFQTLSPPDFTVTASDVTTNIILSGTSTPVTTGP